MPREKGHAGRSPERDRDGRGGAFRHSVDSGSGVIFPSCGSTLIPGRTRCIPEGIRRFLTWAPLLIPFYIPRGADWDFVWTHAEALHKSAEPTLPAVVLLKFVRDTGRLPAPPRPEVHEKGGIG